MLLFGLQVLSFSLAKDLFVPRDPESRRLLGIRESSEERLWLAPGGGKPWMRQGGPVNSGSS